MGQLVDTIDAHLIKILGHAPADAPKVLHVRDFPDGFRNGLIGPLGLIVVIVFGGIVQGEFGQKRIIANPDCQD